MWHKYQYMLSLIMGELGASPSHFGCQNVKLESNR